VTLTAGVVVVVLGVQCIGLGSVPCLAEVRLGSAFTSGSSVYSIWISITPYAPMRHFALPGLGSVSQGAVVMSDGPTAKRARTEAVDTPNASFGLAWAGP
jgi:hypothetical protein